MLRSLASAHSRPVTKGNQSGGRIAKLIVGGTTIVSLLATASILNARSEITHSTPLDDARLTGAIRETRDASGQAADSAAAVAAVSRFHAALAAGDSATAIGLLATDALIIENGDVQTRLEYRSHHLAADVAFAAAVPNTRTVTQAIVRGDIAWITATSTTQGTYRDRPVKSVGAELTVLSRTASGWQIRAVHWSSHAQRP